MSATESVVHESTAVSEPERFPWLLRVFLFVVGSGIVTLLITARTLEPHPSGMGTHQGLFNLPPCSFRLLFDGMPCPSCGMTTSWAHLTRGHLIQSLNANPGGTLLGLVCLALGPFLVASGLLGKWFPREPSPWIAILVPSSVMLVSLAQWIVRIVN
jgi:Protein of unknown function (DUF2752)